MEDKCPNPNGEEGICYTFDKFGDRAGCLGCELYIQQQDPLPGLTAKLKEMDIEYIKEIYKENTQLKQEKEDLIKWLEDKQKEYYKSNEDNIIKNVTITQVIQKLKGDKEHN